MIHIISIPVANKAHWGDVITKDIVLPAKIHHIRGIMGNVLLGKNTYFERLLITTQETNNGIKEDKTYAENPLSVQIGTFSLSINNSVVVGSDIALCTINELHKSGYKHNLVRTDNIAIDAGSMARIEIEETLLSPFITTSYFDTYNILGNVRLTEEGKKKARAYFGEETLPTLTNDYIVKIYIDYD